MNKYLRALLAAAFWLAVWQTAAMIVGKEILLPSVVSVCKALFTLLSEGSFYAHVGLSVLRVAGGFAAGVVFGVVFAVLSGVSKTADALLAPLLVVMKATPVASIIIILLVWLNRNSVPAAATVFVVLPLVAYNVYTGIKQTDGGLLEMSRAFHMSVKNRVAKLYIPSVLPYFASASATGIGMAWKAGVAAEVICNPEYGIGSCLYDSKIYLETDKMFAWTAVVVGISALFEALFKLLIRRGKRRRGDA